VDPRCGWEGLVGGRVVGWIRAADGRDWWCIELTARYSDGGKGVDVEALM